MTVSPKLIPPVDDVDDANESADVGVVVPIPMLPFARMVKSDAPEEDATENGLRVPEPWIENLEELIGVVVPMEMLDDAIRVLDVAPAP